MTRRLEFTVPPRLDGRTAEQIMQRELGVPSGLIRRLKRSPDAVLLNGRACSVVEGTVSGDRLTLTFEDDERASVVPVSGPVDVVYRDEDILVVNKPPRLPCHPTAGNRTDTLANYLTALYLAEGNSFTPRVINRLDANTSGLVLLAVNPYSAARLNSAARQGLIKKLYSAVTVGVPSPPDGEICAPIGRCADSSIKREVCGEGEGDSALTRYRLTASGGGLALLSVETLTGRTHQIRVHLASIGCPLAGDFLYGAEDRALIPRHALHMGELSLLHPVTGEALTLSAPLPEDMRRLTEGMAPA